MKLVKILVGVIVVLAVVFGLASFVLRAQNSSNRGMDINNAQQQQEAPDLINAAEKAGLAEFARIVRDTGMEKQFQTGGPYTIFAPSDEAIAKYPPELIDKVKSNQKMLRQILNGMSVNSVITAQDIDNKNLKTIAGDQINITKEDNAFMVNGHKIMKGMQFNNGVIYEIDSVMLPESLVR